MQTNGEFVLYDAEKSVKWTSASKLILYKLMLKETAKKLDHNLINEITFINFLTI